MHKWMKPDISELKIKATAYSPENEGVPDGDFKDKQGNILAYSYGPSGDDHGTPKVDVNET